jgi:alkanesulfonate monooxygenase SsuD/methylene tetrahydromethanopterin reductase-like flavin-dependent oxidoreductase (luciferase family)
MVFGQEQLLGTVAMFRASAREAGRDPDTLTVVARANVPVTPKPIDDERPFLGGSPEQIAEDLAALEGKGIDQVLFANGAFVDLDTEVDLLAQLATAAH